VAQISVNGGGGAQWNKTGFQVDIEVYLKNCGGGDGA
jgi:hypothetical protein